MEQDYNVKLYEKAYEEFQGLQNRLCEMTGAQAMEHAYEKVVKEDILACMEMGSLDDRDAKALYKKNYPLDFVYQEWLSNDFGHMGMLADTLASASNIAYKDMKISQRESR